MLAGYTSNALDFRTVPTQLVNHNPSFTARIRGSLIDMLNGRSYATAPDSSNPQYRALCHTAVRPCGSP